MRLCALVCRYLLHRGSRYAILVLHMLRHLAVCDLKRYNKKEPGAREGTSIRHF